MEKEKIHKPCNHKHLAKDFSKEEVSKLSTLGVSALMCGKCKQWYYAVNVKKILQ